MNCNLSERITRELSAYAKRHAVDKVVLFGSRARGTNTERSDVDIAVYGGDFEGFYHDVHEDIHSLLMFDIVDASENISEDLQEELRRDGKVIYEKT